MSKRARRHREARCLLRRVIADVEAGESPSSVDLAMISRAFRAYLDEGQDLAEALGFASGPGAPPKSEAAEERELAAADEVRALIADNVKADAAYHEVGERYGEPAKTVAGWYRKHKHGRQRSWRSIFRDVARLNK